MKRCFRIFLLLLGCAVCGVRGLCGEFSDELTAKAEKGDVTSQYRLGCRFFSGNEDSNRDYVSAAKWLQMAAESNHLAAQALLGYMYVTAYGVPPDVEKGMGLLRRAADAGDKDAQNYLGVFYETGRGVLPDRFEAINWYMKAAAQGDETSKKNLTRLREGSDAARKREALSNEWWQVSVKELEAKAEQGDVDAQNSLGFRYEGYGGTEIDFDKARYWYERAAAQTNAKAHYSLSQLYVRTTNVLSDKAFYHCSVAAGGGHGLACLVLGRYYRDGFGTVSNRAQALHWFTQAAKAGQAGGSGALYSLVKGSATFDGAGKRSRLPAEDYSPPEVKLKILDSEGIERTVRLITCDVRTELVETDYQYGPSRCLPLAAFHADSRPVIENELCHETFAGKVDLSIDERKLSRKECEELGSFGGKKGSAYFDYEGYIYTLEFSNRGDVDIQNLDVECRFYYKVKELWRTRKSEDQTSRKYKTHSFRIPKLQAGSVFQSETPGFVLESYNLPSGYYYIEGGAEVVDSRPEGLYVRMTRTTADGCKTYRDFCEPPSLSSKTSW